VAGDLQERDVGRRVGADDGRLQPVVLREVDEDLVRALDHVVVGDDVAFLVDHEAGAERLAALLAEERLRDDARRHLDDSRGGHPVDLADGSSPDGRLEVGGLEALFGLADDGRRAAVFPHRAAERERETAAEQSGGGDRGEVGETGSHAVVIALDR
jgi:hypothetical protein